MGVDNDRRTTAPERRARVIKTLNSAFDLAEPGSAVNRFGGILDEQRTLIANADIDGIVSSMMVASVTDWRVGVLVDKTAYRHHASTDPRSAVDLSSTYVGVDVFSTRFPNVSNHPVLFGGDLSRAWSVPLRAHDERMRACAGTLPVINASLWYGIEARLGSAHASGLPYKYPFGSAQILLAVLESLGRGPRFFDRQYLPWLVANCDGGVDTIRSYAWNAETWWSALAAVVGPASHSETLYRLATNQRPNEFLDADRRLRYEEPERSRFLNSKWNLTSTTAVALRAVVSLVTDLTGWPDPFIDGVQGLEEWTTVEPRRGVLPVSGLTKLSTAELSQSLEEAAEAIHLNFSVFRERGTALGWMLASPSRPGEPAAEIPVEVSDVGDPESTPDDDAPPQR